MTRDDIILARVEGWIIGEINENYRLEVKQDSKLMKFLNFFVRIFNKRFMDGYITTFYPKVYFPADRLDYTRGVWKILTHEAVHLLRAKKQTPVLHGFLYGLPQWLALLALLSLVAIWASNWWLLCLLFLLCAAPLPAYFRYKEEMVAYRMSMFNNYVLHGSILDYQIDHIAGQFFKSNYYWMWAFKKAIYKRLQKEREDIMSGKYDTVYPYSKVKEIIEGTANIYTLPPRG